MSKQRKRKYKMVSLDATQKVKMSKVMALWNYMVDNIKNNEGMCPDLLFGAAEFVFGIDFDVPLPQKAGENISEITDLSKEWLALRARLLEKGYAVKGGNRGDTVMVNKKHDCYRYN